MTTNHAKSRRGYSVLFGAIAVAGVFALGAYQPNAVHLRQARADIKTLNSALAERADRLEETGELCRSLELAREQAVVFEDSLPENIRLGKLLEAVDRLADESGLEDPHITPARPRACGPVSILPVTIDFDGSFEALYEFVRLVETLPRVARIDRLELARTKLENETLVSTVTVHVYFRPS